MAGAVVVDVGGVEGMTFAGVGKGLLYIVGSAAGATIS